MRQEEVQVDSQSEDEWAVDLSDDEGGAQDGAGGMELGNVVAEREDRDAPAPADLLEGEAQPLKLPTFQFASSKRQRMDGRVLLLFDINGVLMQHTWTGTAHHHDLRPGVHHLLRLAPHFRLGIYSSATRRTISKALTKLHGNLANFLEQRLRRAAGKQAAAGVAAGAAEGGAAGGDGGEAGGGKKKKKRKQKEAEAAAAAAAAAGASGLPVDAEGFPLELPGCLFEVVLARDHCQQASQVDIEARGGRPWDTVKPLARYFGHLDRVVLIDDSAHKASAGEGANMLIMPCWPGGSHPLGRSDGSLQLLVDSLLAHAGPAAHAAHAAAAAAHGAAPAAPFPPAGPGGGAEEGAPEPATEPADAAAGGGAQGSLDVRQVTAGISQQLAAAAAAQLERARASGLLNAEQAAAAAQVVEAAVNGSAAVAAAAAAGPPAVPQGAQQPQQQEPQQQGRGKKRQQPEGEAPPHAAAAGEPLQQQEQGAAAAAAAGEQQPATKRQRREQAAQQQAAVRRASQTLLLAAAAELGAGAADAGDRGATLAEINAYLGHLHPHLCTAAFNKTAKGAVSAAIAAGLLQPAAAPVETEAAGGANGPAAGGQQQQRKQKVGVYVLTAAGEAAAQAAAGRCSTAELEACCGQFRTPAQLKAAMAAARQGGQQQQQQGEQGEQGEQAANGAAAAPQQLPLPAGAPGSIDSLQEGVLLQAVSALQRRRGVPLSSVELWAQAQLKGQYADLTLFDPPHCTSKAGRAAARLLRLLLQQGLVSCEEAGLVTALRFGAGTPGLLLLCRPTPAGLAAVPSQPALAAALTAVAAAVGHRAADAAAQAAAAAGPAAGEAAAAQPAAVSAAGAAQAAAQEQAAPAQDGARPDAEAAAAPAAEAEEAVPMLLAVFEDRAPPKPPAQQAAAGQAAAEAQPAAKRARRQQEQQQEQQTPATTVQQQQEQQQEQEQQGQAGAQAAAAWPPEPVPAELFVGIEALPKKHQKAMRKAVQATRQPISELSHLSVQDLNAAADRATQVAMAAALTALPRELVEGMEDLKPKKRNAMRQAVLATLRPISQLKELPVTQLRKLAWAGRAAAEQGEAKRKKSAKSGAKEVAAEALDRLYEAAVSRSDAVWAAAVAALSAEELSALEARGIQPEKYREMMLSAAMRGGGSPPASEGGALEEADAAAAAVVGEAGEEEEEVGMEVDGEEEEEEEEEDGTEPASEWEPDSEEVEEASGSSSSEEDEEEEDEEEEASSGSSEEEEEEEEARPSPAAVTRSAARAAAAAAPAAPATNGHHPPAQQAAAQAAPPLFFWEVPASGQKQQQGQRQGQQQLSPLHYEVESFAARATPTPQEAEAVASAVLAVSEAAASLWPQARTALFGSQATGLALPGSDLDIVVLNVGTHLARAGGGFTPVQRKQLTERLEDLLDALLQRRLLSGKAQIIEAKVPIIKCKLAIGGGLAADISLGAENGAQAVDYVRRQVLAVPPLRPLCLAVKAFLREKGHNEVFSGGLSSYSVFNMVLAHLQCEGWHPDTSDTDAALLPGSPRAGSQGRGGGRGRGRGGRGDGSGRGQGRGRGGRGHRPPPPADLQATLAFLQYLSHGALPALCEAEAAAGTARPPSPPGRHGITAGGADLGVLLWSFFDRFGSRFSYTKHAVSIRMGGVCLKLKGWKKPTRPWLLAVEDPQEMGRDIGSGSFAIREIKECFAEAAEQLAEVCEDLDANQAAEAAAAAAEAAGGAPGTPAAARQQQQGAGQGGRGLLLAGVLDVEAAVGRTSDAAKARAALESTAAAKAAQVLHQRIRSGVSLTPRQPTGKQLRMSQKMASKAERKAAIREDSLAGGRGKNLQQLREQRYGKIKKQQKGQQGQGGGGGGKRLGSRRTAAVEAQWGSSRGQYKDHSDGDDGGGGGSNWSLKKQKKPKKKGKGSGQQQQRKQKQKRGREGGGGGGDGGAAKKRRKVA